MRSTYQPTTAAAGTANFQRGRQLRPSGRRGIGAKYAHEATADQRALALARESEPSLPMTNTTTQKLKEHARQLRPSGRRGIGAQYAHEATEDQRALVLARESEPTLTMTNATTQNLREHARGESTLITPQRSQ